MAFWTLALLFGLVIWTGRSNSYVSLGSFYTRFLDAETYESESYNPGELCPCSVINDTEAANCENRNLSEVPNCVSNETKRLLMSYNGLQILKRDAFSRFLYLELLNLSHCNIQSLDKDAFGGLGNLRVLDLSGNKLLLRPDTYNDLVFQPLQKLKELFLGGNIEKDTDIPGLDYPDQALSHLSHLEWLGIDGLRNRSFGPGFSKLTKLRGLDVSGVNGTCSLEALRNSTFQHLKGVTHLSLKECRINYTETGTFLPLRRLQYLCLSKNCNLTLEGFAKASVGLRGSQLRVLHLNEIDGRCIVCKTLCGAHLCNLRDLPIEELHLSGNKLRLVQENATSLCFPKGLTKLIVRNNYFFVESNLLKVALSQNISVLDAGRDDPRGWSNDSNKYTSTINKCHDMCKCPPIDVDETKIVHDPGVEIKSGVPWPPCNIEWLSLSWQRSLMNINENDYNVSRLTYLDMTGLFLPNWIGPVKGLQNLRVLNLSCNFAHYVKKSFFINTPNIEVLNISWNSFKHLFEEPVRESAFFPLKKLRVVDLSFNQLSRFPNQTTELFGSVEELYLAGNKLVPQWFDVDFSLFRKLRILDVSQNSLSTINRDVCHSLDRLAENHTVELRFQLNPIQCTCDNVGFTGWLYRTKVILSSKENYTCMLEDGRIKTFVFSRELLTRFIEQCKSKYALAMVSLGAVVLSVAMALFAVIYRYRWHLRYLYYATRSHLAPEEEPNQVSFDYDTFVSYASEDESFVRNELMPRLEGQEGLRLCIHSRDFIPGRSIISNTVEAVQRSRRTLCLVSRNFLDSYWCTYEMQMAKMESLHTGRDVVVMVLYEQIRACSLPKEVLFYIRSESYVEFPRDPRCEQYFWDNLVRALK